MQGVNTFIKML